MRTLAIFLAGGASEAFASALVAGIKQEPLVWQQRVLVGVIFLIFATCFWLWSSIPRWLDN